jgi:hypothetical protein
MEERTEEKSDIALAPTVPVLPVGNPSFNVEAVFSIIFSSSTLLLEA